MRAGFFGGATRNRTGDKGFADLCLTAWLWRHILFGKGEGNLPRFRISALSAGKSSPVSENSGLGLNEKWARKLRAHEWSGLRGSNPPPPPWQGGALPNELNPRKWCLRSESNQRHGDFQSPALPTELQRHTASKGCIRMNGDPDGARTHDLQRDRLAL